MRVLSLWRIALIKSQWPACLMVMNVIKSMSCPPKDTFTHFRSFNSCDDPWCSRKLKSADGGWSSTFDLSPHFLSHRKTRPWWGTLSRTNRQYQCGHRPDHDRPASLLRVFKRHRPEDSVRLCCQRDWGWSWIIVLQLSSVTWGENSVPSCLFYCKLLWKLARSIRNRNGTIHWRLLLKLASQSTTFNRLYWPDW